MGSIIIDALKEVFGAILDRFFPPKTAADQKADDLSVSLSIINKENEAAANSPTDKEGLIKSLKDGSACVLLLLAISLSSCADRIAVACPVPIHWTEKQESEMAAALDVITPDSPIIKIGDEWLKLRNEAKACLAMSN